MSRSLDVFLIAALAIPLGAIAAEAAPVVVSPSNMDGWAFDNRDVNGVIGANPTAIGQFVNGPSTPPLGTGSAQLATGNGAAGGDGASELRNTGYAGILLSSLTTLSYSTFVTQNNGQQFPYFGLHIDTDGDLIADNVIFFEPPYQTPGTGNGSVPDQGATALNTWQTWDALNGGWWDNNGNCNPGTGVTSLSACLGAAFATATIQNAPSGLGGVRFSVGFASDTDQFNGYVDNLTIGINGANTTFDFELAEATPVPEPATLALFGSAVLGLVAIRRRARERIIAATSPLR